MKLADDMRADPVKYAKHLYDSYGQESLALVDQLEDVDENFRAHVRAELQECRRKERSEPKA